MHMLRSFPFSFVASPCLSECGCCCVVGCCFPQLATSSSPSRWNWDDRYCLDRWRTRICFQRALRPVSRLSLYSGEQL
ncbi:hypothetical protein DFP73DRAFT_551813 [Morchella snyderi]|nr:hypothetical protein DFP73DRAFT_551813 [Morchella snyderi]